jgi:hypothetical protein
VARQACSQAVVGPEASERLEASPDGGVELTQGVLVGVGWNDSGRINKLAEGRTVT